MRKEVWIKAYGDIILKKRCYVAGIEAGAESVILDDRGLEKRGKFKNVLHKRDIPSVTIKKPTDMKKAEKYLGKFPRLIVELADWNVIPIENLISASDGTSIIVLVKSVEEAELHLNVLEKGVDGLLVDSVNPLEIKKIIELVNGKRSDPVIDNTVRESGPLDTIKITSMKNIDSGDRVCVDTCVMIEPGEGMLVGSSSSCLFLVESETDENGYIEPRPFRVNAGAVHSYIMLPDGTTRYLSELRSGDPVMLIDSMGTSRDTTIGRCKIERRPLVMVQGELDNNSYSVMLQNAETVRLVGPSGPVAVTSLKVGDEVFCRLDEGGRHNGRAVDESIREL